MIPLDRSLTVLTDGEPLSFSGRIRLRGQDELSLFPALFTLDLWNLPEEGALRISRCRSFAVNHGESCLVSGTVSDVYRRAVPEGILTTVSVSLGLNLWEAYVSLTVPAGTAVSETVRQILEASGTGIPLLAFPADDPVSSRGQSFFSRAAECVASALSAVNSRAMLTPSGLMVAEQGDGSARYANAELLGRPRRSALRITDQDLMDTPAFVSGGSLMILPCTVAGWRPGQTVEVEYKNIHARGIVTARIVDADTGSGAWKCELLAEVLR